MIFVICLFVSLRVRWKHWNAVCQTRIRSPTMPPICTPTSHSPLQPSIHSCTFLMACLGEHSGNLWGGVSEGMHYNSLTTRSVIQLPWALAFGSHLHRLGPEAISLRFAFGISTNFSLGFSQRLCISASPSYAAWKQAMQFLSAHTWWYLSIFCPFWGLKWMLAILSAHLWVYLTICASLYLHEN